MRKMQTGLLAALVWAACATTAYAQNAQITGAVNDSSGGVIPDATVTASNVETGLTRTAVTDGKGEYRLPSLPPGVYAVSSGLSGFSTETRPGITLIIDQTVIINFTLRPAAIADSVTVTGESPIVDITRSDVSTSVSTQQIQALPVASRRWIDLAMLTPGVSQDNIRGFFYRGNVNLGAGTREYSNGVIVDGVNNTWAEMGEPRQNFAMDAIQEFKVSTSTYKAEVRTGDRRRPRGRDQVGHEPAPRLGTVVLPRRGDYRQGVLPGDETRLPAVSVPRHDRWTDREEQDALLLRLRGNAGESVLHRERAWTVASVRRDVRERAGSLDVQLQDRSPADLHAEALLPLRRRGRIPADRHGGRTDPSDGQL